jgi:tetratricopeptide (TPR) repeat protein
MAKQEESLIFGESPFRRYRAAYPNTAGTNTANKGCIMPGKIMTALTKIEAENLWSKGRLHEAMKIYTNLIASSPNMTLGTRVSIESRIKLLRDALDHPTVEESSRYIDAAIQKLDRAVAADRSVAELRKRIKSFYKNGRYADTLESLKELVRKNATDEFCVNATAECIVRLHTTEDIPVAVDLFLAESLKNAEKADRFKTLLAEKMAQKGYHQQSQVLHRHEDRFQSCK